MNESWEERRGRRIRNLRLILGLFVTTSLAFTAIGFSKLVHGYDLSDKLQNLNPIIGLFPRLPFTILFLVLWAVFFRAFRSTAEIYHDRFWGEFDQDLFLRVTRPRGATELHNGAALNWVAPAPKSHTAAAWAKLDELISELDTGTGATFLPWSNPDIPRPFTWTIILGRPGSGKSRMAAEFARKIARRDVLGDGGDLSAKGRLLRIKAWLRRSVWFLSYAEGDPWDTGYVAPVPDVRRLEIWRPAKSTLLLLDDPTPGACGKWLAALYACRRNWVYPVRLLIVNQSIPTDLALNATFDERGVPSFEVTEGAAPLACQPITLNVQTRWNEREIRLAINSIGDERLNDLFRRSGAIADIVQITKGNPLLVELALAQLVDSLSQGNKYAPAQLLKTMSRDKLLKNRAKRVLMGWSDAQIDEAGKRALAAAALVGPPVWRNPVVNALNATSLPKGTDLLKAFPGNSVSDPNNYIPSLRPEMIADAVVRCIVDYDIEPKTTTERQMYIERASVLVDAGYRGNAGGWLRAVERLSTEDDILGLALRNTPPLSPNEQAIRELAAKSYLRLAMTGRREPIEIIPRISKLADGLAISDAGQFWSGLWRELEEIIRLDTVQRQQPGLPSQITADDASDDEMTAYKFVGGKSVLLAGAHVRSFQSACVDSITNIDDFLADLRVLFAQGYCRGVYNWSNEDDAHFTSVLGNLTRDLSQRAVEDDVLVGSLVADFDRTLPYAGASAPKVVVRRLFASVLSTCSSPLARVVGYKCAAASQIGHVAECEKAVQEIEKIGAAITTLSVDREFQFERAQAWSYLAWARADNGAQQECQMAVAEVEKIAVTNIEDRDMQLQRAGAWGYLAVATGKSRDIPACQMAVNKVEEITTIKKEFKEDSDLQLERAKAWKCLSIGYGEDDYPNMQIAVNTVEEITTARVHFLGDRELQTVRVLAWGRLSDGAVHLGDPRECERAVDKVEEITTSSADLFEDFHLQILRANAWQNLARACSIKQEPSTCQVAVNKVTEITTAKPEYRADQEMQLQNAATWGYLGGMYALKGDDIEACQTAVNRVEEITTARPSFMKYNRMQLARADAWYYLAALYSKKRDKSTCRATVDKVVQIASARSDFLKDSALQQTIANARSLLQS